jgi:hypothetical protein
VGRVRLQPSQFRLPNASLCHSPSQHFLRRLALFLPPSQATLLEYLPHQLPRAPSFESRIAFDTAFRSSGNATGGSADKVDTRTRRSLCASPDAESPVYREDRQSWPIAGVFPLAPFDSVLYARRSCGMVSFLSTESVYIILRSEYCQNGRVRRLVRLSVRRVIKMP